MNLVELFTARSHELEQLLRRPDPTRVCPDSTPVLFFGSLETAEVATMGINPSWQEFLSSKARAPLRSEERRLLHRSEVSGDEARDADAALARMRCYFDAAGHAYWPWFKPLECLLRQLSVSLGRGSAAHTDVLSCFATLPAWGGLTVEQRRRFSSTGFETFRAVVRAAERLRLLIVIGATARRALEENARLEFRPELTSFDKQDKMARYRPVVMRADWQPGGRRIPVIAVSPYLNRPLSPLRYASGEDSEVAELGLSISGMT